MMPVSSPTISSSPASTYCATAPSRRIHGRVFIAIPVLHFIETRRARTGRICDGAILPLITNLRWRFWSAFVIFYGAPHVRRILRFIFLSWYFWERIFPSYHARLVSRVFILLRTLLVRDFCSPNFTHTMGLLHS